MIAGEHGLHAVVVFVLGRGPWENRSAGGLELFCTRSLLNRVRLELEHP